MSEEHFEKYEEWTQFKHNVINHYLWIWAAKVGLKSPGNKVYFVDGFAGGGVYEGRYVGSPIVAAKAALEYSEEMKKAKRKVECIFVEESSEACASLNQAFEALGYDSYKIYQGLFEEHIDKIVQEVEGYPSFIFIDPYGPTDIPFVVLEPLFKLKCKSELLINFNLPGLNRIAGWLDSEASWSAQGYLPLLEMDEQQLAKHEKARKTNIKNVTAVLGSDDWKPVLRKHKTDTNEFYKSILNIYMRNLRRHFRIVDEYEVRERHGIKGRLKYYLIHCANHEEARTVMKKAVNRESAKAEKSKGQGELF